MKKNTRALLLVVLLLGVSAFAGLRFRQTRHTPDVQTTARETQTAVQAAADVKAARDSSQTATQTETAATQTETAVTQTETAATQTDDGMTGVRGTYTGLFPLPTVHFTVPDADNSRGLSTARIDHSFGVPKNEQPNFISVDRQKAFDASGKKAVVYDNKSTEKVLYLTFDCGYENGNTEKILDVLQEKGVPAAFFCTQYHIENAPALIARMICEGHIVGNHSKTHPDFSSISRTKIAQELEAVENLLRRQFGYSSRYFRFPEGAYSESALDAVDALGFTSVFWSSAYADWDTENQKGKQYALDTVTSRLHPGAILLLHAVSPDNAAAMADIIDVARSLGYTFRSLDDLGKS